MPGYIHHVEWCVRHLDQLSGRLVKQYGFTVTHERRVHCQRENPEKILIHQVVLRSGTTIFVLTENRCETKEFDRAVRSTDHEYPVLTCCKSRKDHARDSVFNVCVEVGNVDKVTERVKNTRFNGANIVPIPPRSIKTQDGSHLRYSVVRSCCGNVIHSIINLQGRREHGEFLPGFGSVGDAGAAAAPRRCEHLTTWMDHVTYVCRTGEGKKVLEWYISCFGMKRFLVSSQDAMTNEGIEIGDEVGMRMMVGEWISTWLCREDGVEFDNGVEEERKASNFKLVLAEPLEGRYDSHVQHFIDNHGGPGIQHIGLAINENLKVETVVQIMTKNGASFRKPPPTYYKLEEKIEEIRLAGSDVAEYEKLGLLLDSEADFNGYVQDGQSNQNFLIQIFTVPIFKEDTFFLEVLERRGARGFGAGNILALAKSIIQYREELNHLAVADAYGND